MALPRFQLFEFNDSPWVPAVLRDTIVEALSRAIRWGGLMDGLVAPLARCLDAAGTSQVLDLCAGAGGPAAILCDAMAKRGHDVHFLMSDLFPAIAEWESLRSERLDFVAEPVDATHISPALGAGRVRVIINALHHFPPDLAKQAILGACAGAPGVFIAESLVRNPVSFLAMAPVGIAALLATPALAKDRRLARALLTWFSPVALAVSAWDGTVSSMRIYEPAELQEMVAGLEGWTWTSGQYAHSAGLGSGSWFSGTRA
ncbi:MAG: hypothetical protein Q8L48_20900 [Archangium sp.]|nr:hypothetical protein [Archangium sp.]